MIPVIQGLSDLAADYDVLLSDVWGVIHNGQEHFPEPCAALARWRAERGPVILISNSPRPAAEVIRQLDGLGVPRAAWTALVTSGDVTRTLLAARAPGPAWAIGPERDAPLYEGLGLAFAGPQDAAFISCTGPVDDEKETPEDYRKAFELAALEGLEMICANPDLVVQRGPRLIYCGGALAALYAELGGKVTMAGKPYALIYDACLAEAEHQLGRPVDRRRVLAIGDGVPTDIAGANAQDLDVLFVAGGIHGGELVGADGSLDASATEAMLAAAGARAAYVMPALAW
jgi:HAD superfamily hydrolase (TIGR01459 family)